MPDNNPKLLVIEVSDINSVPVITYKGKELMGKIAVSYDWVTRNAQEDSGVQDLIINYCQLDDAGYPHNLTIRESRHGHD